ncbi:MAG: isocitrate lyase/phosphoenolpyruvate mutase family protein [Rhodospirillales bacterium]|nr:isocitrate lyase/phosphoenolpyruvate mutase family protein [Rhodospirillales bacterium]MBO6788075.1 isocitrate lyase/phosphoenolpyruvate mutase family protein [Rhodospirillales bacterium]
MHKDAFLKRHSEGPMIRMPNAWDAGSARIMEAAGADAIATTSAGIVYTMARPDYEGDLSREECLRAVEEICATVDVPVSVDSEDGYGDTPEEVEETFQKLIQAGARGGSIEDHARFGGDDLMSIEGTVARIHAARQAIDKTDVPFVLTARAECFLVPHPDPMADSLKRIKAYEDAGADCLYIPGLRDRAQISTLLNSVETPVNILVGMPGFDIPLDELETMGVRRISTGGSIMCATLGLVRDAVAGLTAGDLDYLDRMITHADLTKIFGKQKQ